MIDRVIVDGVDLMDEYDLLLTYDSEVKPPMLVERYLEIPGMDGVLDLTESLSGDATYSPRIQEFVFDYLGDQYEFEEVKTKVANFLHGRAYDYTLTFDPGYTYHGRFAFDSYFTYHNHGQIKVIVTSDPWKRADHVHLEIPAANGVEVHLTNRRRRVSPTFTCLSKTIIGYKTKSWVIEPGETYLNELALDPGDNVLFIDSKPEAGPNTWNDVLRKFGQSVTWNQLKDMRWSEVAKYGVTIADDPTSIVQIDYDTYDL